MDSQNTSPQFEFRVWDRPNKMFLQEFQTDYGQWVWGRRKDLVAQSTFKWILEHPKDFVVNIFVGVCTSTAGNKIFTGDVVQCWDVDTGVKWIGVIEFVEGGFALRYDVDQWGRDWYKNKNIEVIGNIFQNPELLHAFSYVG